MGKRVGMAEPERGAVGGRHNPTLADEAKGRHEDAVEPDGLQEQLLPLQIPAPNPVDQPSAGQHLPGHLLHAAGHPLHRQKPVF